MLSVSHEEAVWLMHAPQVGVSVLYGVSTG